MLGAHIGNYRLVAELGEGGMGTVYFAEHDVIGRRAAIKILRAEVAAKPDIVERFFNEARAVNEISHPNIVTVTDFGCVDGRHYIVMELLEGETLGERIERERRLSEPAMRAVTRQIASALGAAHARGIIHRDLKPENVFLCNHPDLPDHVKVLDFGIAKLGAPKDNDAAPQERRKLTDAGVLLGTPMYMSPEQCMGESSLGPASDVYSLGIVMYEMATGRRPFESHALGQLIVAHVSEAPAPPALHNNSLSLGMSDLILKALAKKPEERFGSMAALRDAVDALERRPRACAFVPAPAPLPIAQPEELVRAARVGSKFEEIIFRRIRENRLRLPAIPAAAMRCLELTRQPTKTNLAAISTALAQDPLLAAQVLRLANSATYSAARAPVGTIDKAVSRLGLQNLTTAIIEYTAHRVFVSKNPRIREAFMGLWEHSLAVGIIARELGRWCGGVDGDALYLAGLLHDVGKPVLGALLLEAERVLSDDPDLPWLSEGGWREVVTGAHRAVGVALAESWALPSTVIEVIKGSGALDGGAPRSACNLVCIANALAKRAGFAVADEPVDVEALLAEGAALIGIDLDRLHDATADLADRLGELTSSKPLATAPTAAVTNAL